MIVEIFSVAFLIMLASLAGIIFVWTGFGNLVEKNLKYLVTFAAGVFIAVIFGLFDHLLFLEGPWLMTVSSAVGGAVLLEVTSIIIPEAHHHHGSDKTECARAHMRLNPKRILLGDAIHNMGDGILLVPAFMISSNLGIATSIAIFFHELVQGISEFFVLKEAGYTTRRALALNFTVSTTILVGIALSLSISSLLFLQSLLTGFAFGGFIYIILRDLLPHTLRSIKYHGYAHIHALAAISGAAIVFGIDAMANH